MISHARLLKLGLDHDRVIVTQLLQSYSGAGAASLAAARRLFDETPIPARDPPLWTSIISAYANSHHPLPALHLFSLMPHPNPFAAASATRAAASLSNPFLSRSLHALLLTRDLLLHPNVNVVVQTSIVNMYAKSGDLDSSRKVFDEMLERNVVTWNSLISGYANAGKGALALEMFYRMRCVETEVAADGFTISSTLTACAGLGDRQSSVQVHAFLVVAGFGCDSAVSNSLANMYFRCGDIQSAERAIEDIEDEDSVILKLMMVKGYVFNELYEVALRSIHHGNDFVKMIIVDPSVVGSILTACSNLLLLRPGRQIHGLIVTTGVSRMNHVVVDCALIDMYSKCSGMEQAQVVFDMLPKRYITHWNVMITGYTHNGLLAKAIELFDEMPEKNVISWTAMISGYIQSGLPGEGLRLFARLYNETNPSIQGNCFTLTSALDACSSLTALRMGKQIHAHILRTATELVVVQTGLVDMYSKSGNLNYAQRVFDRMVDKNVITWTSMITGYSTHGLGYQAIEVLEQMMSNGFRPNEVTFVAILSACSHCGFIDEGLHYFSLMRNEYKIAPTSDHYSCVIDMLVRSGKLDEAWKLITKLKEINEEDGDVWGAMLGGCELHGNVGIGSKVAKMMVERKQQTPATYVSLANVYATAEMWDDVYRAREESKSHGVVKEPGQSLIHIN
ncbi:TPR-like protein [Dioscorea alata]|uniref:TPR-like protein n=1 Tax=Dioscorea alata TaxID=55571 RepID=A0ACB7WS20_DIOAL|nr:TPR-like protein [Dioscorea alata]